MTEETKNKKPVKEKKAKPNYYVTNKELLREIEISRKQDKMTEELGVMLMKICKRYAVIGRFANYTYNEDMQAFALMTLCRVWRGFNPEKSNNPFAYFTQIINNAFFQLDNMERKQRDIRDAILVDQGKNPSFSYSERVDFDNSDDFDQMEIHDMIDPHMDSNSHDDFSDEVRDVTEEYISDISDEDSKYNNDDTD